MIVGIDLGKTGCRALVEGGVPVDGPGAPGLAEPGGVRAAAAAVATVLQTVLDAGAGPVAALCVGVAGAEAAPHAAAELAELLAATHPGARVAVTSDSVTSHAGALGGRPGAVMSVGTGITALSVQASGERTQVDGWGPWLGDDGAGSWIGREGLRSVLRAAEGRGPRTALTLLAERRFGDLAALPTTLAAGGTIARTTGSFTPDVILAAEGGDAVARDVLDRAVACWAEVGERVVRVAGTGRLSVVGGLARAGRLEEALRSTISAEVELVPAEGSALEGALLLAVHEDLPHESAVVRRHSSPAPPAPNGTPTHVDGLATEQVRADLADLDAREPSEVVALLLEAEAAVPAALAAAAPQLTAAVRLATAALAGGGRLVYVGAGTPGRLAALDAAECPPTFGTDPGRVVALCAGGDAAAREAVEGAEDDADAGRRDLVGLDVDSRDLVVGITASGRTPYVLAALEEAARRGAATVAVVNNPGSAVAALAEVAVELLTGAETLSGSTRLKAGTSQKIALNVVSTAAMVGAGHTYGAWMVDVLASNEKLRRRARRILREAAGVDDAEALAALEDAGWRTKTALVALLARVPAAEAQRLLAEHGGRARAALAAATLDEVVS